MSARTLPNAVDETREQRIEDIMKELRPKIDEAVASDGGAGSRCAGGGGIRGHRLRVPRRGAEVGQRCPASQRGEPEKKGYVGCSVTCPLCEYAAKFHSYQPRRVLTVHGEMRIRRAYYYCGRCKQSFLPYDDVLGLGGRDQSGVDAAGLLGRNVAAVCGRGRGCAASVFPECACRPRRCCVAPKGPGNGCGRNRKKGGWSSRRKRSRSGRRRARRANPAAYVGLDAFSVPMQGVEASKAEHRMLYTALLYTPEKEHTRYLVDFELDALAKQVRSQAQALGVEQVSDLIAVTDGGNGLEEALQRHLAEHLKTILDWYHAAEHLCDFAKVWHASDEATRSQWQHEAKSILYEQGGEALLTHLLAIELPPCTSAEVQEELRKLIGYFENNRHRTDYPTYRQNGWDIGSGPTEAGCKIIGERLKGSGMRWVEDGAATVAALRALYVSGGKVWDGFWSQPHRAAA